MRGTKPTKRQAIFLREHRLNSDNWIICKDAPTEMMIKREGKNLKEIRFTGRR